MLKTFFADLHVHIGQDYKNNPVKISGSKHLTLTNILKEASRRKGIDIIGVIDAQVPTVMEEINSLLEKQIAIELADGGIVFENVTLILGAEIEVYDDCCQGPIHVLAFLPTLEKMGLFSAWLKNYMKNISLSSQRFYGEARGLQKRVKELDGLFIPAHVFTPFKSLYGKGVNVSLEEVFDPSKIDAIELGLSSDTEMADQIGELHAYSFITNSDSHSLAKIGREYQQLLLKQASFKEISAALKNKKGRKITANYGMNPKLGKYYRTVCQKCFQQVGTEVIFCPHCESRKIIKGVADRITQLKTVNAISKQKSKRPPYIYQVPLEYIPGLGPKTKNNLLKSFH